MVRYSFPVGLFHSLFHAGLSRRTSCSFVALFFFLFTGSTSENCSFLSASSTRSSITVTLSPIENSRRVRCPIILRTFS